MLPRSNVVMLIGLLIVGSLLAEIAEAVAATTVADVNSISATGVGASLGTVTFADTPGGLLITPKLSGLPPGQHGFHIHDKGDCGPGMNLDKLAAGFAAGGHYDPAHTKKNIWGHSVP